MKKYIVSDPNILGGKPVIVGTRIPVDQILQLLKNGFTLDAIHQEYPQLNITTISGMVDQAAAIINNNASEIL